MPKTTATLATFAARLEILMVGRTAELSAEQSLDTEAANVSFEPEADVHRR